MSGSGPTGLERVLLGLFGVAAAVGSLWLTLVISFIAGLSFDCSGPHDAIAIAEITLTCALATALVVLLWLLTVSLLRVAAGRRWLRRRAWLAAPLIVAAVAAPFYAVAAARTPPPSETCVPFSLD